MGHEYLLILAAWPLIPIVMVQGWSGVPKHLDSLFHHVNPSDQDAWSTKMLSCYGSGWVRDAVVYVAFNDTTPRTSLALYRSTNAVFVHLTRSPNSLLVFVVQDSS